MERMLWAVREAYILGSLEMAEIFIDIVNTSYEELSREEGKSRENRV